MIRIMIAEDHALVSGALAALLRFEPDMQVISLVKNGQQALEACQQECPDILLTDIEMPVMTGLELAASIAEQKLPCKVIMLTAFARAGYLRRATASGVRGYMLKDSPSDCLAAAIRTVQAGGRVIAPELAMEGWNGQHDPLSERERQVLRLAGSGAGNADIARQIHLSEGTVRNYLSDAISKMHVRSRGEAYRIASDAGWL